MLGNSEEKGMGGMTWALDEPLDIEAIKERIVQSCEDAAKFLMHAPDDLDALIKEVERLQDRELLWYTT